MRNSLEAEMKSYRITKLSPLDIWVGIGSLAICFGFSCGTVLHAFGFNPLLPISDMPPPVLLRVWLGPLVQAILSFVTFLVTYRIFRTIRRRSLVGGEWFFVLHFFDRVAWYVICWIAYFQNIWPDSRWAGMQSIWLGSISIVVVFAAFLTNLLERRFLWALLFASFLASTIMGLWGFNLHESLLLGVRGLAVVALFWDLRQGNKRSVIHITGTVLFILASVIPIFDMIGYSCTGLLKFP